ncbi:MAG: DUF4159 domain-containing protein, partial [Thermodesulfobacteriota bacterium]
MISRRRFVRLLAAGVGAFIGWPGLSRGADPDEAGRFILSQLQYRGGDWDPHPQYFKPFIEELQIRTSVDAAPRRHVLRPMETTLFLNPFVYVMGRHEFAPFTMKERETLSRFLEMGGFILADDSLGQRGYGFDRSFRQEIKQILPNDELTRLPPDHAVYRSFYLLREAAGRLAVRPYLEGITRGNWTPVIYCQNDLAGAWAKDRLGRWLYPVIPGGDEQ